MLSQSTEREPEPESREPMGHCCTLREPVREPGGKALSQSLAARQAGSALNSYSLCPVKDLVYRGLSIVFCFCPLITYFSFTFFSNVFSVSVYHSKIVAPWPITTLDIILIPVQIAPKTAAGWGRKRSSSAWGGLPDTDEVQTQQQSLNPNLVNLLIHCLKPVFHKNSSLKRIWVLWSKRTRHLNDWA